MQEAAHKFRRYASTVERDIETLVFEMLDLIDSKTRTLRKLMKLHLNVRKVSRFTDDRNIVRRKSSPSVTSICNTITETLSITESTKHAGVMQDSMLEVSDFERKDITQSAEEIEATFEDIGVDLGGIRLAEADPQSAHNEALKVTTQIVEGLVDDVGRAADEAEDQWVEADTDSRPDTPEMQHPNSPSNFADTSRSSMHSYSIVVNLEGALSNLEGCQPGDCGVFMDQSTYRNVVDTLRTAIACYGLICASKSPICEENGSKLLSIGKSSTQPVLNVTVDEAAWRSFSSTGCEKHARKKRG